MGPCSSARPASDVKTYHKLSSFKGGPDSFDAEGFHGSLSSWCADYRLECSRPFLASWYNEKRKDIGGGTQPIEAPDSAVAFVLYSVPGYLETVAGHYRRVKPSGTNFVDSATDELLEQLRASLDESLEARVINTDLPPYYHVQTIGNVAGVDEHIEADSFAEPEAAEWREELSDQLEESRDRKMWGTDPATLRKIFGVNAHPVWGGWYAYRALIVLHGTSLPELRRSPPLKFLDPGEAKRIISEYNLRHEECAWRDLGSDHAAHARYTTDEFFFFTETKPARRRRWLEMRASELDHGVRLRIPETHSASRT